MDESALSLSTTTNTSRATTTPSSTNSTRISMGGAGSKMTNPPTATTTTKPDNDKGKKDNLLLLKPSPADDSASPSCDLRDSDNENMKKIKRPLVCTSVPPLHHHRQQQQQQGQPKQQRKHKRRRVLATKKTTTREARKPVGLPSTPATAAWQPAAAAASPYGIGCATTAKLLLQQQMAQICRQVTGSPVHTGDIDADEDEATSSSSSRPPSSSSSSSSSRSSPSLADDNGSSTSTSSVKVEPVANAAEGGDSAVSKDSGSDNIIVIDDDDETDNSDDDDDKKEKQVASNGFSDGSGVSPPPVLEPDGDNDEISCNTGASEPTPASTTANNNNNNNAALLPATPGAAAQQQRDHQSSPPSNIVANSIEVGTRVYARWPENDEWYWGAVTEIFQKPRGKTTLYSVEFDDGDFLSDIPPKDIVSQESYYSKIYKIDWIGAKERYACGKCSQCRKPPCTKCHVCLHGNDSGCFQKICGQAKGEDKCYPALSFPSEWFFTFEDPKTWPSYSNYGAACPGLIIMAPNGRRYLSAEKAKNHNPKGCSLVNVREFNRYVGLLGNSEAERKPQAVERDEKMVQPVRASSNQDPCGMCTLCQRPACGSCHACTDGKTVCFQKMCCLQREEDKAICAPFFPKGWRFIFQDAKQAKCEHRNSMDFVFNKGLIMMGPKGNRRYPSVERAISHNKTQLKDVDIAAFKVYVGLLDGDAALKMRAREDIHVTSHPLLGKEFLWEWLDANRRVQSLYGTVTQCRKVHDESLRFMVAFEEISRQMVNSALSEFQNFVPSKVDGLEEHHVWSGCLLAYQTAATEYNLKKLTPLVHNFPSCFNWIVPRVCHDAMVEVDGHPGIKLPRRTILVRGFELVFQVKQSGIPGADYGVWVRCRPVSSCVPNSSVFELEPGHLVDFGVYSPLQKEDRKPEHISIAKNLIHNYESECYNFGTAGHEEAQGSKLNVLDITNDITGDLHDKACTSVLPRVNEISGKEEISTVHAEHDASGAVHYLLGHYYEPAFRLPADGTEIEIKVDYGASYEKVRVRKGYPRVSEEEQVRIRQELEDDDLEITEDILGWDAKEVIDVAEFLVDICKEPGVFPEKKRTRILLVALLLRARSVAIQKEIQEEEIGCCALNRALLSASLTKELIHKLTSCWWKNNAGALSGDMRADHFLRVGLGNALGCESEQDLVDMSADELHRRIIDL